MPASQPLTSPSPIPARLALAVALACACLGHARAATPELELGQMSLEDLMQVEVSGVSRKAQRLTDTAAAAFVLTAEDIQRSGATSLPELLRLVPGLEVARIGSSRWAVSARGFNSRFANKLQVQIDGRSVYSPLFSGVFWEAEGTLIEDIERIEVVRGPGAALWGANAVNGVINIVTRSARRTQGELAVVSVGDEDRLQLAARHGERLDDDGAWRLWAQTADRREVVDASGQRSGFDWRLTRAGARLDRDLGAGRHLSVMGGAYSSRSGESLLQPLLVAPYAEATPTRQLNEGGHWLGRFDWGGADGAQRSLQAGLDVSRIDMQDVLSEHRSTVDLDFQSREALHEGHDLVWGLGFRHSQDRVGDMNGLLVLAQPRSRQSLWSAFVHDEIAVRPEQLKLILGTKVEHFTESGADWQPNARLLWTPAPQQTVWAAVSRAMRMPSRAERDADIALMTLPPGSDANPAPLPVLVRAQPAQRLGPEQVVSSEAGYRTQLGGRVSLDLAVFHARYRGLRSGTSIGATPDFSGPVPHVVLATATSNALSATTQGLELALDWHVRPSWRLQLSGNLLHVRADRNGDPATDEDAALLEGSSPRHQLALRSSLDLPNRQQLDVRLRRVGARRTIGVDAYTGLDLRWAWRATPALELSLAGENLLGVHAESDSAPLPSQRLEVPRGVSARLRWQF